MKTIKKYILAFTALLMMVSCYDGIDPITEVDPGPDAGAPVVTILKPTDGFEIQVPEPVTSTPIEFRAEDDIELASVTVSLDGQVIATFDSFLDYRIFNNEFVYDAITTGEHVLQVSATDLVGNTTTVTTNFSKEPPYTPLFNGETFYMNFDGSFTELITVTDPTEIANPGFAPEARVGSGAFSGNSGYLTFPTNGLLGAQFSASFWTKVNADPDRAGVLVIGPPDSDNPNAQNNRTSGFRFFRENAGGMQRYKLNVGRGDGESWFDGGSAADVDPTTDEWVHLAFTISETEAVVYINGEVVSQGALDGGIDWTGCDLLSIMSGAPRFTGWGHLSDHSYLDELRLFNIALTQNDIIEIIAQSDEIFKVGFNGSYKDSYSGEDCTEVGNPGFTGMAGAIEGSNAYQGAVDSYLTFPTDGLLNDEFSAVFNYKVNAEPDRAGILVIGPPDAANPDAQNNRTSGFRLFRENAGGMQRIKLNVGNGTGDNWFDGGAAADIDPNGDQWIQIAFTISGTESVVYIDGQVVKQGDFSGVDWTDCDVLSIMSGAPRFTGWGHLSDESAMDNLRIYKKALSQAEIQAML